VPVGLDDHAADVVEGWRQLDPRHLRLPAEQPVEPLRGGRRRDHGPRDRKDLTVAVGQRDPQVEVIVEIGDQRLQLAAPVARRLEVVGDIEHHAPADADRVADLGFDIMHRVEIDEEPADRKASEEHRGDRQDQQRTQ
jgi:hypothetical protein